jgi:hypothetical protein
MGTVGSLKGKIALFRARMMVCLGRPGAENEALRGGFKGFESLGEVLGRLLSAFLVFLAEINRSELGIECYLRSEPIQIGCLPALPGKSVVDARGNLRVAFLDIWKLLPACVN